MVVSRMRYGRVPAPQAGLSPSGVPGLQMPEDLPGHLNDRRSHPEQGLKPRRTIEPEDGTQETGEEDEDGCGIAEQHVLPWWIDI